ncbi:MAG: extracellular solute-binding protein [Firmicutes bacterium]|nr:extracellular solute-binding protein [Bacillota bacterium]
MRRTLAFIAAMVVLFAGCGKPPTNTSISNKFNETGYPIMEEKIVLKMMGITDPSFSDWSKNLFYRRMEEMTNICFEYTTVALSNWGEKKNLAFASDDLPDVFFKSAITSQEELTYGDQLFLIPLEMLIEKHAPNLNKIFADEPEIKKAITAPDRHIYALPSINEASGLPLMYINEKWLDNLGLRMPETMEEFVACLRAFKNDDPNMNKQKDEIPLTIWGIEQLKRFMANVGLLFGDGANVCVRNDKVIFTPSSGEYKNALIQLRSLYKEELLDNDTFTQTQEQVRAKGSGKSPVLGCLLTYSPDLQVGPDRHGDYVSFIPLKLNDGSRVWPTDSKVKRGKFAITNKNSYPEATIRWIDYLYSEEGGILSWAGKENEDFKFNDNKTRWQFILEDDETVSQKRARTVMQPGGGEPCLKPVAFWNMIDDDTEQKNISERNKVRPYFKEPFPLFYIGNEEQKKADIIKTDVNSYADQMLARFITGDASLETEWDGYIKALERMGLSELLEIYNKAYGDYAE